MKKFNKVANLLLVLALALSLADCGSSSGGADSTDTNNSAASTESDDSTESVVYRTVDEIVESGTINIGVFSDKSPFGYVEENGDYQGYDIYFANRIGEDLGVEVNFVSTEAANRIEYLQTGKVDVILANFTVTEDRAEEVDFALPYMNVSPGVVSPDDNVITSLEDWNEEDKIIVLSGATAETCLTENYPDITLQKCDTYANAKNALGNGNGVAWANDNTEVIAFALENEGLLWASRLCAARTPLPPLSPKETAPCWTGSTRKSRRWVRRTFSTPTMRQLWRIPTVWTTRRLWWSKAVSSAIALRTRKQSSHAGILAWERNGAERRSIDP